MIRTSLRTAALAVTLATGLAAPAFSQTPPLGATAPAADADNDRLDGAWNDVLEVEGSVASPAQFAALNNLAYQAAVVRVCDGYTLDDKGLGNGLAEILIAHASELTDEQDNERTAAILIAFGARYGLFIAEGHVDKQDFCASAAKLKSSPGGVPLFFK